MDYLGCHTVFVVEHRLTPSQHLAWIRENIEVVLAVPLDQLEMSVVDCPGWQLDSVANHLAINGLMYEAGVHLPVGAGLDLVTAPVHLAEPSSGPAAIESCRRRYNELLTSLESMDPSAPCSFITTATAEVATWLWHIAAETWVHRADIEHTLGMTPDLNPDAGLDALAWSHHFRVWLGELNPNGPPAAIRCRATDSNATVVAGSGPVAASVSGKGCDLALRLWNRQHGPLQGDGDAVQAWADLPRS